MKSKEFPISLSLSLSVLFFCIEIYPLASAFEWKHERRAQKNGAEELMKGAKQRKNGKNSSFVCRFVCVAVSMNESGRKRANNNEIDLRHDIAPF